MRPGKNTKQNAVTLMSPIMEGIPYIGEPHGLSAIAGHLKAVFPDLSVTIIDSYLDGEDADFGCPAILGISLKLRTLDSSRRIIDRVRRMSPENRPLIMLGGCLASVATTDIADNFPEALVSVGEGEPAMEDAIRYVRGEIGLNDCRNVVGGVRTCLSVHDFNLPDRSRSKEHFVRGGIVYAESSRGCPYGACSICGPVGALRDPRPNFRWRTRPDEQVVEDFRQLARLGVSQVTFADEEFFGFGLDGVRRAAVLADRIRAANIGVGFRINTRVDSIAKHDESPEAAAIRIETLQLLKDAGMLAMSMGLESGCAKQLIRYRKGFVLDDFLAAVRRLNRLDMPWEIGWIPIDPLATLEDVADNLCFLKKHQLVRHVSSVFKELRLLRGTPYAKRAIDAGLAGSLNVSRQEYASRYVDQRVLRLCKAMRPWKEDIYRLEYALRIATQYEDLPNRHHIFRAIAAQRYCDYHLMEDIVLKLTDNDSHDLSASVRDHGLRRGRIVEKLREAVAQSGDLSEEIDKFLEKEKND